MRVTILIFTVLQFYLSGQTLHYYFGNLHAHTGFSDGSKDSSSSGVSRPDGAFAYAKLTADFDFLGISEHNHYSTAKNPGFRLPLYQQGLLMADAANSEGSFLALFGMEYGISSSNNGHVVIYGFNQLIGWETGVGGISGNNYDIYNPKNDYSALFKKVAANSNAFCYLAHPYWTDFTKDGTNATALAFSPYDAGYDSAIAGMPLRSGNAFSTFTNYADYPTGEYFDYYKKLLNIGYHLGIGYDHDNHNTNFGRGNGGRLVIIAPQLSRANLYNAMREMHFYGSDDQNARVAFTLGTQIMGSIITGTDYPVFSVVHDDPDGEDADTIKIWKGHRNSGGLWAEMVHIAVNSNSALYTDQDIEPGIEYYYFAEIKQADNQWMVTSPIWYTGTGALGLPENEVAAFVFFPNPVTGKLNVSFATRQQRQCTVADQQGRIVAATSCDEQMLNWDLSGLFPGVYIFTVRCGGTVQCRKLVIQ
jgi:hypothetical protein